LTQKQHAAGIAKPTIHCFSSVMMRTIAPTLATVAVIGFCAQARAQERCPELTQLRSDAADALRKATGAATQARCDAYIRYSVAWADTARWAHSHRELCGISLSSLSEIDSYHSKAVDERETVCGRPHHVSPPSERKYTFPAEIRPHW
jgi:hypothetical protein